MINNFLKYSFSFEYLSFKNPFSCMGHQNIL